MVYIYWSVAVIVVLFVVFGILDTINRKRAHDVLPQILPRDWIDEKGLRMFLKLYGVSLTDSSFVAVMKNESVIVETRIVSRLIDGERVSVRQYRRRFGAPITSSTVGLNRQRAE